jgi:hypothetical protein
MTCKWQHDGKLIGTFENIDHGTMVLLELAAVELDDQTKMK